MESTYAVDQLSFSMFALILTFDFDLILGHFLPFEALTEYGSTTVLGSTHLVEQLSFSMFPLILTFDFDLYLGSFFTLLGSNGLILELG